MQIFLRQPSIHQIAGRDEWRGEYAKNLIFRPICLESDNNIFRPSVVIQAELRTVT